ncbi:hypothetical protein CVT26_003509 [Gymnopilus dilepis]|uniref:Uncharacterized protein n=1 Tax=Gymnopilus dilepis TaxID=231916 RepID=A0A409W350_9AGAR|nr:hypothetical protein CVT26_003509 [Gymnopilus dilepis]
MCQRHRQLWKISHLDSSNSAYNLATRFCEHEDHEKIQKANSTSIEDKPFRLSKTHTPDII